MTASARERVARAMWEGLNRNIDGTYLKYDHLPDPQRGMLLETADAALAAMPQGWPEKLPCDVKVAPHTTICQGCDTETLRIALEQRARWKSEGKEIPRLSPPLQNPIWTCKVCGQPVWSAGTSNQSASLTIWSDGSIAHAHCKPLPEPPEGAEEEK